MSETETETKNKYELSDKLIVVLDFKWNDRIGYERCLSSLSQYK